MCAYVVWTNQQINSSVSVSIFAKQTHHNKLRSNNMTFCSAGTIPLKTLLTWSRCAIYIHTILISMLCYVNTRSLAYLGVWQKTKGSTEIQLLVWKERERNGVVFIYWRKLATAPVEIKSKTISSAHTSCTFNRLEPKRQSIERALFCSLASEWIYVYCGVSMEHHPLHSTISCIICPWLFGLYVHSCTVLFPSFFYYFPSLRWWYAFTFFALYLAVCVCVFSQLVTDAFCVRCHFLT